MSNINWIKFKTVRTAKEIDAALREVITKRFGDPECLIYRMGGYWDYNSRTHGGVGIKTKGKKRVEFKPGAEPKSEYAEFVIRSELGVLYDGMCGGEFDPEAEWEPNPAKYPTLENYITKFYR